MNFLIGNTLNIYAYMILLHNIGQSPSSNPAVASNYNTREQILNCNEPISFDGIYWNVYINRDVLKDKDVTLFVMGDYVGKDNSFDVGMPNEQYCDWNEIMELVKEYKCKLGWHTWSHPDLTTLSYSDILKEVTPPFPMEDFAYPYGRYNEEVIKAVKEAGYKRAWSVTQGTDDIYSLKRNYL